MGMTRRIKKRLKADRLELAKTEMGRWQDGLQQHWHVTVRRLMMAGTRKHRAEWMAYRAIVEGMSGRNDPEAYEDIAKGKD